MNQQAMLHLAHAQDCYQTTDGMLHLRFRTGRGDIDGVRLLESDKLDWEKGIDTRRAHAMQLWLQDSCFDYWTCSFMPQSPYTMYCFELSSGTDTRYYMSGKLYARVEEEPREAYNLAYHLREQALRTGEETAGKTMYQIFPDSFASGRRAIRACPAPVEKNGVVYGSRLGGTIEGIRQNLDYLEGLGITLLYLNPVWAAYSYHKYDVIDYYAVDPAFGTLAELHRLVEECAARGIGVIMDLVFNHCSNLFAPFVDVVENGEKSRYRDWFYGLEYPVVVEENPRYASFARVPSMPKTNTSCREMRDYLIGAAEYWMRELSLAGFRLDVADEVPLDFWSEFNRRVLAINPNAYLLAEAWDECGFLLEVDGFHASMNYPFLRSAEAFFSPRAVDGAGLNDRLARMFSQYRWHTTLVQMNLLDSHDITRFKSKVVDEEVYRNAVAFQMLFPGIPSVYYGDELGMVGVGEEEYRAPMAWEIADSCPLRDYFATLVALRRQHPALMLGGYRTLFAPKGQNAFAYLRFNDATGEKAICAVNNGDEPCEVVLPGMKESWRELFGQPGAEATQAGLRLTIPARGRLVLFANCGG